MCPGPLRAAEKKGGNALNRYTPIQRSCAAGFLLALLVFWSLSLGEEYLFRSLILSALGIALMVGIVTWLLTSISDLRYQVAILRAEIERLKNKE